jgi:hypothetical protein
MSFRRSIAGKTSNPAALDRFTISNFHAPGAPHNERHLVSGISAIGKNALDEREQSDRLAQKMECSITVLRRPNEQRQQETQRIDRDMPLAP